MAESVCELEPLHSSQKSFGWKAIVVEERDASQLFSYGVLVATATKKLGGGDLVLTDEADYSTTTRRHVKEFVAQKLGKSISTEELRAIIGGASVADVGAAVWQN